MPASVDRPTNRTPPGPTVTGDDIPARVTADITADVLVVGAGPAGVAAALELRRAGRHVVLVDKARFPRDKCCGDGLTTLALRELEHLGLDPASVERWTDVDGAWIRSPSGREVYVPLPTDGRFAAIAPRLDLDHALVRRAIDVGVEVIEGHGVEGPLLDGDDHIEIGIVGIGRMRARYIVAADGMWSTVRKLSGTGAPGYRGDWHAFRQYACSVTGPAAERLYVWFEPDLLPGYAWSFPLPGGRVNIGFGILRDGSLKGAEMASLWTDLLDRPHVRAALGPGAELEGRHTAWPIPAAIDRTVLATGRMLFVGDAAAATDVLTGEGIGQALLTGRLAAEAITAAGATRPDLAGDLYRASVAHHLFADHRMSARLGRILASERGARAAVRIVGLSGEWGRRNFARWMFEDEPRSVITTPSRWHRRFLARPGAWADAAHRSRPPLRPAGHSRR